MKPPRKAGNFSTSFLDIILGALGAFFLLLILVSVSRRGDAVEGGSRVSKNLLCFRVNPQNFIFSKHVRFFAAIYDENHSSYPFSDVCFSETLSDDVQTSSDGANAVPRLIITPFGGDGDFQLTLTDKENDAPNVLVFVWLAFCFRVLFFIFFCSWSRTTI